MRKAWTGIAVASVATCVVTVAAIDVRDAAARVARSEVQAGVEAGLHEVQAGRYREAKAVLRRAAALAEHGLGPADLDTARVLNALGMVDKYTARYDEGATLYRRALEIAERARPSDPLVVADILHNLGGLEHARERFAEGEPSARRGLEVRAAALGPGHVALAADRARRPGSRRRCELRAVADR